MISERYHLKFRKKNVIIWKQKYRECFYRENNFNIYIEKIILLMEIININCKQFFIKKRHYFIFDIWPY